jgi:hypothetical protein
MTEMRAIPLIGWYLALISRAAQPRASEVPERNGLRRVLFGSRRPGHGWGYELWAWQSLPLLVATVGFAVVGLWWASLLVIPLLAYPLARMVGTYRERYRG